MIVRRVHLVRHGRSTQDWGRPPHEWGLDPRGHEDVDALRRSGRLPERAVWFSSPETKALETARRLTEAPVTVVPELREHERHCTTWIADFPSVVRRAFDQPDEPAYPGWEPLTRARDRLMSVVPALLAAHAEEEVVLVGHGTAWTLLASELTGTPPDLGAWSRLRMPDLWVLELPA
jgi:broad specificity phosphatase PhoE